MKIIRGLLILLSSIIIIISGVLYRVSQEPIHLSGDFIQRLIHFENTELSLKIEGATLSFNDYALKLVVPQLQIIKAPNHVLQLENVDFSWKIFSLHSELIANISNSELLTLLSFPNQPIIQSHLDDFNSQNHLPFNGELKVYFSLFQFKQAEINLAGQDGWHQSNSKALLPIKLNDLVLSLSFQNDILTINKFQLQYDNDLSTSLNGEFRFEHHSLTSAIFGAEVHNLPIKYLAGLWPKILFPEIHQWVTDHVTEGMVTRASGNFKFNEADFMPDSIIPKDAINAEIEVKDASVSYLEQYSPITKINGIVKFDGDALYVNADNAALLNGRLTDIALTLAFNDWLVSLKAKAIGKIADFVEFIPDKVHQKLALYGLSYSDIQGNILGSLDLQVPITDEFKINDLRLFIKADLENVVVDKFELIKIQKGEIELTNEADKMHLKVNQQKLLSFNLTHHHDPEQKQNNQIRFATEAIITKPVMFDNIQLNQGSIKIDMMLTEEQWDTKLDLSDTEIYVAPLGYTKKTAANLTLQCMGNFAETEFASDNCNLKGNNFTGQIFFAYIYDKKALKNLTLKDMQIGSNKFTFQLANDNNIVKYRLDAQNLDMSKFDFHNSAHTNSNNNYTLDLKVNKLLLKNQITLSDAKGYIGQQGNNPPAISFSAISGNDRMTLSKAQKDDKAFYALYSTSAALFTRAFGIYDNIKKGELWIEVFPNKTANSINYSGNILVKDFAFTNTSVLTKVILGILSPLNSPQAMAQALQGGSLKADSFTAQLNYQQGLLKLKNGLLTGESYKLRLDGNIDVNNRQLHFKGLYIPSFYGINSFIAMIPLLGKLLDGGDKSAFLAANFSVKGDFDNPTTYLNPISVLTPGFIRELFN